MLFEEFCATFVKSNNPSTHQYTCSHWKRQRDGETNNTCKHTVWNWGIGVLRRSVHICVVVWWRRSLVTVNRSAAHSVYVRVCIQFWDSRVAHESIQIHSQCGTLANANSLFVVQLYMRSHRFFINRKTSFFSISFHWSIDQSINKRVFFIKLPQVIVKELNLVLLIQCTAFSKTNFWAIIIQCVKTFVLCKIDPYLWDTIFLKSYSKCVLKMNLVYNSSECASIRFIHLKLF